MGKALIESVTVGTALRLFADAALGLAEALEGAQPVEAAQPAPAVSYGNGAALCPSAASKRRRAEDRAAARGYEFERWCRLVRTLRVEVLGTSVLNLAARLGVSTSCVYHWERGTGFPHFSNLLKLEVLGEFVAGWSHEHWRGTVGQ
jgi:ribosome-binding protein aMBF1 (putative translation factor)|tara:strand:- start:352 stop:792 length:441 start_codon:yes stop_codon:yes gene_type:complete